MYRQGDVSLHLISKLPINVKKAKHNILAYGEVTGHQHRMKSNQICVFEDDKENKFVVIEQATQLVHDYENQHGVFDVETATKEDKYLTIMIHPGVYAVKMEREFDPFAEEIRQVLD